MPPIMAPIVDAAPEEFKTAAALACLTPLGVVGCQLEALYCDGKAHTPIFQTTISAPQASGKSWLIDIVDRLMKPVTDLDDKQLAEMKEYQEKVKDLKMLNARITMAQIIEILGPRPTPIVRDLGTKVSTTAMMELMHNAQGLTMVMRSDEADSLTKAWSTRNTDNSDMLRIGWDGGWYKQHMASLSKTFSGKVRLQLATSLAGTPDAFKRLFPNVENGAVGRQLIINLGDMFGQTMPHWRELTEEESKEIDEGLYRLNAMSVADGNDGVEIQPRHRMNLDYVNEHLQHWCLEQSNRAKMDKSHTQWVFHKRSAVMGFRAAILAHYLWGEPTDLEHQDRVCAFAEWVANQALHGLMRNYLLPEDVAGNFFAKKPYDALNDRFTIVDVGAQMECFGMKTLPKDVIAKWRKENRIYFTGETVKTDKGKKRMYEKVKKDPEMTEAA